MPNLVVTTILVYVFSLVVAILVSFTKIFLNSLFDYLTESGFFKEYTIFYSVGLTIMIMMRFYYDSVPLMLIAFFLVIIAEVLVFYKKYYSLDSNKRYALFLLVSSIVNLMVAQVVLPLFVVIFLALGFLISSV
jgi:hypothetical protein